MPHLITRRRVLAGAGAAYVATALEGCAPGLMRAPDAAAPSARLQLAPLRASTDRITRITVCTRPFRAQGPRLDVEQVGAKTIVHNYGHGGSGWSLSWGSSAIAVRAALATGARDVAVIGCGAMGLTSALLLQRAGAAVTIYARDLPPNVRSSLATGIWSPDSRICLEQHATPAFRRQWETMARESYQTYQTLLGLPGNPVEFIDLYGVSDAGARARAARRAPDSRPAFAELERELVPDLRTRPTAFAAGTHSLGAHDLERTSLMMFNIAGYARMLMADFLAAGGRIRIAEFNEVADLAAIPQATLINATGYGARALFADPSIVPVRGQVARMIPQPDIGYGLFYRDVAFIPRRDGLVFQVVGDSDYYGYGDDSTIPDRAEAEHAVTTIAALYS